MCFQIVVEHHRPSENIRILRIKTENNANAERVQTAQSFGVIRIFVLLQQCIVEGLNDVACFQGDFHFLFDMFTCCVNQKIETVEFLFKIAQKNGFGFVIRARHVVNVELLKIAYNYPTGLLRLRQISAVSPCLLIGAEHCAVGLLLPGTEINVALFLFNQNFC